MVMVLDAGKMHFRHSDQQNSSGGGPRPPAWASQLGCSQGRAPRDMVCHPSQKSELHVRPCNVITSLSEICVHHQPTFSYYCTVVSFLPRCCSRSVRTNSLGTLELLVGLRWKYLIPGEDILRESYSWGNDGQINSGAWGGAP